jgi:hypothetical protein
MGGISIIAAAFRGNGGTGEREDGRTGGRVAANLTCSSSMSKNINVNPGQYKVAGRERPGEDVIHNKHREQLTKKTEQRRTSRTRQKRKR